MSTSHQTYTPAEVRQLVDDLDDRYRAAAKEGRLEEVFAKERKALDFLMMTSCQTRNSDVRREFQVTRFVWQVAELFQEAKKLRIIDGNWWKKFDKVLQAFDENHPKCFRKSVSTSLAPAGHTPTPAGHPPTPAGPTKPAGQPPTAGPSQRKPIQSQQIRARSPTPAPDPIQDRGLKAVVEKPWTPSQPVAGPKRKSVPKTSAKPIPQVRREAPITADDETQEATRDKRDKKKGKGKARKVDDSSDEEGDEEAEKAVRDKQVKKKGKGKAIIVDEISDEEYREEETVADEKDQGEARDEEDESDWRDDNDDAHDTTAKKRKPPKPTGKLRPTTCKRCTRLAMKCLVQAGGKACVGCAKIKVRCKEVGEDEPETGKGKTAKKAVTYARPVSEVLPAPTTQPVAPAPTARTIKSRPRQDAAPPTAPAPTTQPVAPAPTIKSRPRQDAPPPTAPAPTSPAPTTKASIKSRPRQVIVASKPVPEADPNPATTSQPPQGQKRSRTKKAVKSIEVLDDDTSEEAPKRPKRLATFQELAKGTEDDYRKLNNELKITNHRITCADITIDKFQAALEICQAAQEKSQSALEVCQQRIDGLSQSNTDLRYRLSKKKEEYNELEDRLTATEELLDKIFNQLDDRLTATEDSLGNLFSRLKKRKRPVEERSTTPPPASPATPATPAPMMTTVPTQLASQTTPAPEMPDPQVASSTTPAIPAPLTTTEPAPQLVTPAPPMHKPLSEEENRATGEEIVEATQSSLAPPRPPAASPPLSSMPPPPPPVFPPPPEVTLQPPTPQTSQEEADAGKTTLLHVPEVSVDPPRPRSRSRSRSPAPPLSEQRRSPRLRSPGPTTSAGESSKRAGDPLDEEPPAKRVK